MRQWTWPTPPAWQTALEQVSGQARSDRVPWLLLVWEPGEPWEVIERWMIYEMIPLRRLLANPLHQEQAELLLRDLRGPPPVTRRSWDIVQGKRKLRPGALVTQREWELFRQTGCYGRPYWVLQGLEGGHKRWFGVEEQRLLRMMNRPTEPPAPGDLPYAGWDARVEIALGRERYLLESQMVVRDLERRTDFDWRAERRVRQRALAKDLLAHLDRQLAGAVESARWQWSPSDLPRGAPITDEDMERAEEEFLAEAVTPELNA